LRAGQGPADGLAGSFGARPDRRRGVGGPDARLRRDPPPARGVRAGHGLDRGVASRVGRRARGRTARAEGQGVDLELSAEQRELHDAVLEFARAELNDELESRDAAACFPRECWKKCAEFGLLGLPIPAEYGGQGQDLLTTTVAMEALGRGCRDNGLV